MNWKSAALVALGLMAGSNSAEAVVVGGTFDFTASNFLKAGTNDDPPFATFSGRVTLAFDNGADISDSTSGVSVTGLPYTPCGPFVFSYRVLDDALWIGVDAGEGGGFAAKSATAVFGCNDFVVAVGGISSSPVFGQLLYTADSTSHGGWYSTTGSFSRAVPEPGSLALLGLGILGLGLGRKRRES